MSPSQNQDACPSGVISSWQSRLGAEVWVWVWMLDEETWFAPEWLPVWRRAVLADVEDEGFFAVVWRDASIKHAKLGRFDTVSVGRCEGRVK